MTETISTTAHVFSELRLWLAHLFGFASDNGWISFILLLGVTATAFAGYYLTILILRLVAVVVEKTETDWDDDLINAPLLRGISLLAPAVIAEWLIPHCFRNPGGLSVTLHLIASFYIIAVAIYAVNTFLDNLLHAFSKRDRFQPFAIKGIFQMVKLIMIGIGIIIALSLIVGKSPVAILTALGASAAILMLVFKDTIMGLVASVQLTANKMLQKGDWIVVPKHNANGTVIDISLTTVKIRNWDNSVTTIPPYSLVSDSFQNYQAMRDAKARRVNRHIYVDIRSVRFLSPDETEELKEKGLIPEDTENPSALPNLRLFREYMEGWLGRHPMVRIDLIYMVRQLELTTSGLPLDFYFYLSEVNWKDFEHLQSDIFDHIYASASLFGLTIFQIPSGTDVSARISRD